MLPCDPAFPPNPTGGYGIRPYGQGIALSINPHGRTLFAPTSPHKRFPLGGDSPQWGEMSRSDRGARPRKRCQRSAD